MQGSGLRLADLESFRKSPANRHGRICDVPLRDIRECMNSRLRKDGCITEKKNFPPPVPAETIQQGRKFIFVLIVQRNRSEFLQVKRQEHTPACLREIGRQTIHIFRSCGGRKNRASLPDKFGKKLQRCFADRHQFREDVTEIEIQVFPKEPIGNVLQPAHLTVFLRSGMNERPIEIDCLLSTIRLQRPTEPDGFHRMDNQHVADVFQSGKRLVQAGKIIGDRVIRTPVR